MNVLMILIVMFIVWIPVAAFVTFRESDFDKRMKCYRHFGVEVDNEYAENTMKRARGIPTDKFWRPTTKKEWIEFRRLYDSAPGKIESQKCWDDYMAQKK
jgi:hypothetical protein